MCGIAGIIGGYEKKVSEDLVGSMLNVLEHRGPNARGIETWNSAVLGHRRLSIFDLSSAGHQPMLINDGQIGIVFNGAIYNFKLLKKELIAKGISFKSETDTEVLLHGYKEWGIDELVNKIEGMFAFGLWDESKKTLYLVRDRLGVKPLMFSADGSRIAFASTVRALNRAGFGGGLSKEGLIVYLEFGFLTDENSIYEGIEKVSPGTILEWKNGEIKERRFWSLPKTTDEKIDIEDAISHTEKLFLESVEKRLQADVPIGALLSGGIDSSLVCWAIAKLGGDVTAFTVGVPGDEWDETNIASKTAKQLGIDHEILEMRDDKPLDLDNLIKAYAEPFACASALGLLDISKVVSEKATVLLTGDGGDDVFLGYPEHLHFWTAEQIARKTPNSISNVLQQSSGLIPSLGPLKRAKSFLTYAYGGLGGVTRVRDGLPVYHRNNLLGEKLINAEFPDREIELSSGENLLGDFLEYDRKTRFVGEYLPKVDGGTMFHALEARSPFLDTKLWDFAATLPYSIRMKDRNLKYILREIVRRRISPKLAEGKKQGFGVPVQRWLIGRWKKQFIEIMNDSLLEKEGLINGKNVLRLLEKSENQNLPPRQLWFILVLEKWLLAEVSK